MILPELMAGVGDSGLRLKQSFEVRGAAHLLDLLPDAFLIHVERNNNLALASDIYQLNAAKIVAVFFGETGETDSLVKGCGREMMRHDEMEAERLVGDGLRKLKLKESDLYCLRKGSREKSLLAWRVHTNTMVGHAWIAARLKMGVAANIGKYVREISESRDTDVTRLRSILEK